MNYINNLVTTENEEHVDIENVDGAKNIKQRKIIKFCLLFGAIFILSLIVGILVSSFMGSKNGVMQSGGILLGLGIGAAVGVAIAVLPLIICIITTIKRKK